MPIDPYAALNAMIRAEAARFSPAARKDRPAPQVPARESAAEAPETAPAGEPRRHTEGPAA
ncbi:hypothetical protein BX286_3599 [Streptomyces sp. 3211.6]|uniref:hypothetical protein n=1 Tax=unclassified Streptomyces TaxID=2593676 RepID=UPI000C2B6EB5|nr:MULTISPECIES: hypothetical protein [unclassified Streptomyces]RKT05596.1 hypothetical protein BX286_3599 [Streptomyces sp. 3211.6]RPF41531.1 hypothetical protein EDD96_5338 [Streptomyces sp. Ag109_G2-6]